MPGTDLLKFALILCFSVIVGCWLTGDVPAMKVAAMLFVLGLFLNERLDGSRP